MVGGGSEELSPHILHPLDREALLAVYGELEPGTTPSDIAEELGDWSDTSLYIRGAVDIEGGEIAFGVALRNGLSQPWASGPSPHTNLEDNPALSGTVSWAGRLLGLTPDAEAVAGAADLSVDLTALTGTMDFTGLEQWGGRCSAGCARDRHHLERRQAALRHRSPRQHLRADRRRRRHRDGRVLRPGPTKAWGASSNAMT